MMFTDNDLEQLKEMGISEELAQKQVRNFVNGFPFIELVKPATVGDGVLKMDQTQLNHYAQMYEQAINKLSVLKFVPASGAATRMFKDLFTWLEKLQSGESGQQLIESDHQAATFFQQCKTFAFWDNLQDIMKDKGLDAQACLSNQDFLPVLENLLGDNGLGYAMLPKGLLQFHRYDGFNRTATEEHLVEGLHYALDGENKIKLHFTVSSEHRGRFINHIGSVLPKYEDQSGKSYEVGFSVQKPSTDTIAVTPENEPFRNPNGSLLFRPGGHGALIQNLNELKQDVIFIKNIDNVVPDAFKEPTYLYKKALGGLLVSLQSEIHGILRSIEDGTFKEADYDTAKVFLTAELSIDPMLLPDDFQQGKEILRDVLDRPIRICGMVENVGEPGGGPFWVRDLNDGHISLQIVESSQVNFKNDEQEAIFRQATHFNPVDLVCGVKNYKGESFDLTRFVDHSTGFVSHKSKDGKELKAQELPGLWNGAMANWITLFVEVPLITFNPVKTIMDLLRKEHQG
jgi:hypothetical protein